MFGLANHCPALLSEPTSCPQHSEIGIDQMLMVIVVQFAIGIDDRGEQPVSDVWRWGKADRVVLILIEEAKAFRWIWPIHTFISGRKKTRSWRGF
ncbi:hypothetical protein AB7M29_002842 [Pseudomonas sp. F-14 TE3623]